MIVYVQSSARLIGARSAITPISGLEKATIAVDSATPRLHIELPVKVIPRNTSLSPSESLKRWTK